LQYLHLVYPIPIGVMQIVLGVLGLSLGVKVLHGTKNDQNLYNTFMRVLGLKFGLMEYVLSYPKNIA